MNNSYASIIFSYKSSVAIFAAEKTGILPLISEKGFLDQEIGKQNGWDNSYTNLLCTYLADQGVLYNYGSQWLFTDEFASQYEQIQKICRHEENLYRNWITTDKLCDAVQNGWGHREFDKTGLGHHDQKLYDEVMYSDNLAVIAFKICRHIFNKQNLSVLEIGNSNGRVTQRLARFVAIRTMDTLPLNHTDVQEKQYDIVILFNAIHYLPWQDWLTHLKHYRNQLTKQGMLCIADIFYNPQHKFQQSVLLDWLTHGGTFHIYKEEAESLLNDSGYSKIEATHDLETGFSMYFAYTGA